MSVQNYEPMGNPDGASPWYALFTRHQHEKAVANNLSSKGFEIFVPLYSALHRWKDRNKQLLLPLFPCYVFLRGGLNRRLEVVSTPGVFAFVGTGGQPAAIPTPEIEAIRRATDAPFRIEPHPFLKCGDRVRVKSGPLKGIEGILVRKKNLVRLVISMELLGKSAAVELDALDVERVSTPVSTIPSHWMPPDTGRDRSSQTSVSGDRFHLGR